MAQGTRTELILDIGNACILTSDSEFIDGHVTGWLNFYDTRYRPSFPLTSETICRYLMDILIATEKPVNWRLGALAGFIEAICENSQETFTSVLLGEHVSVMQRGEA
jgi:hypothetical protein